MSATSRLGWQLEEALAALRAAGTRIALIGGLALAPYPVVRATQALDLLADGDESDAVDQVVTALGYRCIHRSDDAANYRRGDERIDFLFATRPIARRLLLTAAQLDTSLGRVPVVSKEGLIGFKLQGLHHDARRALDAEHSRALPRVNQGRLDMHEVRQCFGCSSANRYWISGCAIAGLATMADDVRAALAPEGGAAPAPPNPADAFGALDDLITVVEALCPVWPQRPTSAGARTYVL